MHGLSEFLYCMFVAIQKKFSPLCCLEYMPWDLALKKFKQNLHVRIVLVFKKIWFLIFSLEWNNVIYVFLISMSALDFQDGEMREYTMVQLVQWFVPWYLWAQHFTSAWFTCLKIKLSSGTLGQSILWPDSQWQIGSDLVGSSLVRWNVTAL